MPTLSVGETCPSYVTVNIIHCTMVAIIRTKESSKTEAAALGCGIRSLRLTKSGAGVCQQATLSTRALPPSLLLLVLCKSKAASTAVDYPKTSVSMTLL